MNRKRIFGFSLLVFHFSLLLAGCNPASKFEIIDVDPPHLQGLGALRGEIVVSNDGRRDLVVEEAEIEIFSASGRRVATAKLTNPLKVPARDVTAVDYELRLIEVSLSGMQSLARRPQDAFLDLDARVRLGGRHKKIKLKKVAVKQIIANFAQ